jgi:GntR family transcriptional repressor for pyruvate dehydrogenase complex
MATSTAGPVGPVGRSMRAAKTGEMIAAYLRGRIVRGELAEGDNLPSEVELMAQFDVSRPTLREAFRILETEQLIVIRRGSRGARILAPDVAVAARYVGLLLQVSGTTLADVYAARSVLEPAAVAMLVDRHTEQDIADLTACVEDLEGLMEGSRPGDADRWSEATQRFHDLIMERAGNQTMAIQSGVLREVIATHLNSFAHRSTINAGALRDFRRFTRSCRKLIDLVAAGDREGAERHWRTHMEVTARALLHADLSSTTVLDLFT